MDTSPLKAFATAARVQLLREVSARLSVVLATSSIARVEALGAVSALERAVAAHGGGDIGQKAVIDQVAYMWFNRIISLRFMDANGYTGIGVVSPADSFPNAQPEILTQAKLGQIDSDVLDAKLLARVTGLLNGTIRSEDAQNEAYGILLMAYCRHWNRSMPFMFEKEGDFTELLIPANLLSDESVMAKALQTLTSEVCNNVEVIGWLYQFYISERKDEVFAGFKNNGKAGPAEIPAATQLFTPDWIVRYLVQNSLGRLWLLNHPNSSLAAQMEFYVLPVEPELNFLRISSPEELKVVDPACGSGHMLTYAFDLLYAIYEEEGFSPVEIPILILQNNLFGIEIDPRAGALAAFALAMKARASQRIFFTMEVAPNICVLEPIRFTPDELTELMTLEGNRLEEEDFLNQFEDVDTFGSLIIPNDYVTTELEEHLRVIDENTLHGRNLSDRVARVLAQAAYLTHRYNVVIANPPYMGRKNMNSAMSAFAAREYSFSKSDLCTMFVDRCLALSVPQGYVGMITMHSWMFLSSFEEFRVNLLADNAIINMAHLGPRAFDSIGGEVVSTSAFLLKVKGQELKRGTFLRLVDGRTEGEKTSALKEALSSTLSGWRYEAEFRRFSEIPGSPIAYWLSQEVTKAFSQFPPISRRTDTRSGMATGDNGRFLRYWFEVPFPSIGLGHLSAEEAVLAGSRWIPYNKGGRSRLWYGNNDYVVFWENNGHLIKETKKANLELGKITANNSKCWNQDRYFQRCITWSAISTGRLSVRYSESGSIFDTKGQCLFAEDRNDLLFYLGLLNSDTSALFLSALSPTLDFNSGSLARIPDSYGKAAVAEIVREVEHAIAISRADWDLQETSLGFTTNPLIGNNGESSLKNEILQLQAAAISRLSLLRASESQIDRLFFESFELTSLSPAQMPASREESLRSISTLEYLVDLISYFVGCAFGRYNLNKPGLILASRSSSLDEFFDQVANPTFMPDKDNVIPITDGEWFEDDIVARFRKFLRLTFGDEHFEENLRFIEESLGKDLRKYFITDFYRDHVQRYKKRPIYWLFSSEQGSFNALIYMHRYNPSTASVVLNEYLRDFEAKLKTELGNQERISATSTNPRDKARADKETDRIRKVLLELSEYEHDILYPLATQQLTIDLDDGVKVNYSKFGSALKSIPGLGASDE